MRIERGDVRRVRLDESDQHDGVKLRRRLVVSDDAGDVPDGESERQVSHRQRWQRPGFHGDVLERDVIRQPAERGPRSAVHVPHHGEKTVNVGAV